MNAIDILEVLNTSHRTVRIISTERSLWFNTDDIWSVLDIVNPSFAEVFEFLGVEAWKENLRGVGVGKNRTIYLPYITVIRLCSAIVNNYNPDIISSHEGLVLAYQVNETVFPKMSPVDFTRTCLDRRTSYRM